jgi:hypothetical protein
MSGDAHQEMPRKSAWHRLCSPSLGDMRLFIPRRAWLLGALLALGGLSSNGCSSSAPPPSNCLNPQPLPPFCGETAGSGGGSSGALGGIPADGGAGSGLGSSGGTSSNGGSSSGGGSGGGMNSSGGVAADSGAADGPGGSSSGSGSGGSSGSSGGCGDCSPTDAGVDSGTSDGPFSPDAPSESDAPHGTDSGDREAPTDATFERGE